MVGIRFIIIFDYPNGVDGRLSRRRCFCLRGLPRQWLLPNDSEAYNFPHLASINVILLPRLYLIINSAGWFYRFLTNTHTQCTAHNTYIYRLTRSISVRTQINTFPIVRETTWVERYGKFTFNIGNNWCRCVCVSFDCVQCSFTCLKQLWSILANWDSLWDKLAV